MPRPIPRWDADTRRTETALRRTFLRASAYRHNPASIRVRVVDPCFHARTHAQRDAIVDRVLRKLPQRIQRDIIKLTMLTPEEAKRKPSKP